jgi:hypothetical protein
VPTPPDDVLIDPIAYALQVELTEAIESYVDQLGRSEFRALIYRGVDLSRLISIELYFRLINDSQLRHAFAKYKNGEVLSDDPSEIPISIAANWILRQMLGRERGFRSLKRAVAYCVNSIRSAVAQGNEWSGRKIGALPIRSNKVMFLALSDRFADYLSPIKEQIAADVVWLVPAGGSAAGRFRESGEDFLEYSSESKQPRFSMTRAIASHWPEPAALLDEFVDILTENKPRSVVVVEGNHPEDELLARAAEIAGVRSICLQQGWSPIVHAGFRQMRFDRFCVWGEKFGRLLQPFNPQQKFVVTGNFRVGARGAQKREGVGAVSFFLQNGALMISPSAWKGMLEFIRWTADRFLDQKVLIREHPATPLTKDERALFSAHGNIEFCPSSGGSLREVLARTRVAVSFYSTTLIEALAHNAVPLIVNITGAPHHNPDLAALGVGMEVHDFCAARNAINRLLSGEDEVYRHRIPDVSPLFFRFSAEEAMHHTVAVVTSSE